MKTKDLQNSDLEYSEKLDSSTSEHKSWSEITSTSSSWVDEIIEDQEEDLFEEDTLMNSIPRHYIQSFRD